MTKDVLAKIDPKKLKDYSLTEDSLIVKVE